MTSALNYLCFLKKNRPNQGSVRRLKTALLGRVGGKNLKIQPPKVRFGFEGRKLSNYEGTLSERSTYSNCDSLTSEVLNLGRNML